MGFCFSTSQGLWARVVPRGKRSRTATFPPSLTFLQTDGKGESTSRLELLT
jgi:hypothetical protein